MSHGNYSEICTFESTVVTEKCIHLCTYGVTCSVHDCDIPLVSTQHRYCPEHSEADLLCVVTTCSSFAESGHRTCSQEEHRAFEDYNLEKNKAMFQLKRRLARLNTSQPLNSLPANEPSQDQSANFGLFDDEEIVVDKVAGCEGKPEEGNQTLHARFRRKRTHNEELCITSCGVILGRATFYGSEAPNGVQVSGFF
jgi:hypothetical protein